MTKREPKISLFDIRASALSARGLRLGGERCRARVAFVSPPCAGLRDDKAAREIVPELD
jgi:hypothetical protein